MMATQSCVVEEPDYISFLFSTKLTPDCFFMVGNKSQIEPERIGVVKAMLMAHSVVLRLELEDSKMAEKGDVPAPDIYPDTFRILLRYVYGHDTTAALTFDEADNLLYAAEKYLMGTLKKKLATRLMSLLDNENICSLLNNPACSTDLELNSAITEILRYETDWVLGGLLFLELSAEGFVKILEQDGLNVPEIELWRAMMEWAKHNAKSEDGKALRKQVSSLTEHIRICSLDIKQFCQEVVPADVLTDNEVALVCKSFGQQNIQSGLTEFCNEIKPRVLFQNKPKLPKQFQMNFNNHEDFYCVRKSNFTIVTKDCKIELLPLECLAGDISYEVSCTIKITRITNYVEDTSNEPAITISFNQQVACGTTFMIPLTIKGQNLTLQHMQRYNFRIVFGADQPMYYDYPITPVYDNSHLSLIMKPASSFSDYHVPMKSLKYKATDS